MGYHVTLEQSNVEISGKENLEGAYRAMCELNKRDGLKSGGRYGPSGRRDQRWFAWMSPNYPDECKDAKEVLEALGFDVDLSMDGETLGIRGYGQRTGDEEAFLWAIAPFVTNGGEMVWMGEDGNRWGYRFRDKKLFRLEIPTTLVESDEIDLS